MPIKSLITDSSNNKSAKVDDTTGEDQALVVATRELKTFENSFRFFTNTSYGADMNQNFEFSGTPDDVYNGGDSTQWTASAIVGGGNWDLNEQNVHAKNAIVTVVDYANLGGETITIVISGTSTNIVEGIDYTAETNNDTTATNIATAIDGVTGVGASAIGAVVEIIADLGYDITSLTDDSADIDLTTSARSLDAVATTNGNVAQLARASFVDLSGYTTITGYIFLALWDNRGTKNITLYGWDTGSSVQVGTSININNYVDTNSLNKWHKFTIPLEHMKLSASSIDAFRILTTDIGPGQPPDYYIDYFQIQQDGNPIQYTLAPDLGTWLHVSKVKITIADDYAGTVNNGTMPSLPYDGFLGVSKLANGIVYQRIQSGEVKFSINISELIDFVQIQGATVSGTGSDGTNSWFALSLDLTEPLILKPENDDILSVIISDDLSDLLFLKISAGCKIETRE